MIRIRGVTVGDTSICTGIYIIDSSIHIINVNMHIIEANIYISLCVGAVYYKQIHSGQYMYIHYD